MLNNKQESKAAVIKRAYMHVNVILSFNKLDKHGDSQEFFDLQIPINIKDTNALQFIHKKLFKRIAKKCEFYKRDVKQLIKISTASDWDLYERVTSAISLCTAGHDCKWYFGLNRNDLDAWEKKIMSDFKFGVDADMSWTNNNVEMQQYAAELATQQNEAHTQLKCA